MSLPPGLDVYGRQPDLRYDFNLHALLRTPDWRRHWHIQGPWPSFYGADYGQPGNERWPTLDFDLVTTIWREPDDKVPFTAKHSVLLVEMFDDACHLCMSMVPVRAHPRWESTDGRLFCSDVCRALAMEIEVKQKLADGEYLAHSFGTEVDL